MRKGQKSGQDINCIKCGKIFYVQPNRIGIAKYCSKECFGGSSEMSCILCGNKYIVDNSRLNKGLGKYCSKKCSDISQKNVKRPHNAKWEENRIKAVRENSYKLRGRTNEKSKETIKIALQSLIEKRKENPEYYKELAIKNLPKDVSGDKNGNFRDWATKKSNSFRIENSAKFKKWRTDVLKKSNNKCVMCGVDGKLDAHHIIGLSESLKPAFELWNGVALCRSCHVKTDNFGSKGFSKTINKFSDNTITPKILIKTIPHIFQEYPTVGNYKTMDNETYILVSEMGNPFYETMVAVHEIIEEALTKKRGLSEQDITDFDLYYEKKREMGLVDENSEPGFSNEAPYRREHEFATAVEMQMCSLVGESWIDYSNKVNSL